MSELKLLALMAAGVTGLAALIMLAVMVGLLRMHMRRTGRRGGWWL